MFTGIIQALGTVQNLDRCSDLLRLAVSAPFAGDVKIGDSISVNGACLTAIELGDTLHPDNYFSIAGCPHRLIYFDVVAQTLKTANLGKLKLNDKVNLERALKAGDKISGHFVTGHVDTMGVIKRKIAQSEQAVFEISIENKFMDGIVDKGSVAVDGISLTVSEIKKDCFTVSIIPHTLKLTTLGFKNPGDSVNIELDAMGKYSRQGPEKASVPAKGKITEEFLKEHGF